jgi:hypothetical protein
MAYGAWNPTSVPHTARACMSAAKSVSLVSSEASDSPWHATGYHPSLWTARGARWLHVTMVHAGPTCHRTPTRNTDLRPAGRGRNLSVLAKRRRELDEVAPIGTDAAIVAMLWWS